MAKLLTVELVPQTCWFSNVRDHVSQATWNVLRKVQKLTGLTALCPSCHQVKHIGLAEIRGQAEAAKKHLAKVNCWTTQQTETYLAEVWQIWGERSQHSWKLDLSWLEQEFAIKVEEKR